MVFAERDRDICAHNGCGCFADRRAPAAPVGAGRGKWRSSTTPGTAPSRATATGSTGSRTGTTRPSRSRRLVPGARVYSSSDVAVVRAQMREIASIGVQTVIVSWWGPESAEAARLPLVARAARAAGLRVALHVEPFAGRTPAALVPQLRAFASPASPTRTSTTRPRAPTANGRRPTGSWPDCGSSPTRACPGRPRREASQVSTPTTCGSTTGVVSRACARRRACTTCSALPRSARASTPSARPETRASRVGQRQDLRPHVAGSDPCNRRVVTITATTSGTRERRSSRPRRWRPYSSYNGAYGLTGRAAERAYLDARGLGAHIPREDRPLTRR